jgi:hypothetical protein
MKSTIRTPRLVAKLVPFTKFYRFTTLFSTQSAYEKMKGIQGRVKEEAKRI